MGLFDFLKKKEERVVETSKSYLESDNRGTRIRDMKGYQSFLGQQFMNSAPFVQYTFNKADALAFLDTQIVTQPLHYVVAYTSEGNFGKDKDGGYEF